MRLDGSVSVGLICPHCEKPVEGHDQQACARRMSRRFFFQAAFGGLVAAASVKATPELRRFLITNVVTSGYELELVERPWSEWSDGNLYPLVTLNTQGWDNASPVHRLNVGDKFTLNAVYR